MGQPHGDAHQDGDHCDDYTALEGIDQLVARLASADDTRRQRARLCLVHIGKPAVAPLIKALESSIEETRWEAIRALGQIGDLSAAYALVTALEDEVFDVRWLAAEGLTALGRDALAPLLRALAERPGSVWLRRGAHHVFHEVDREGLEETLQPVLAALEDIEPSVEVPMAAHNALNRLPKAAGWSDEEINEARHSSRSGSSL